MNANTAVITSASRLPLIVVIMDMDTHSQTAAADPGITWRGYHASFPFLPLFFPLSLSLPLSVSLPCSPSLLRIRPGYAVK